MRNGTGRMGLAVLGVVVAAGAVTLAPLPAERGVAAAQGGAAAEAREFNVDAVHSAVIFGIKHAGIAYTYGRFNGIDGTFYLNADDLDRSFVTMTIDTETVDTANGKRDDHLRSPDFFNTKVYPKATFNSTGFERDGGEIVMTGEMMINGKTRTIEVPLEITGMGMAMGSMRAGFHAQFELSRSAFGITWRPEALGDTVKMIVSIEGVQAE